MKGQRGFMNDSFQLSGRSSPSLSNHEKVCKAEIIELLELVDKNQSFSSCNVDGEKYQKCYLIQILQNSLPNKKQKLNTPYNVEKHSKGKSDFRCIKQTIQF